MGNRPVFRKLVTVAALVALSTPVGADDAWKCTVPTGGLERGSYDGGSFAYIHLSNYNRGSNYSVEKVPGNDNKVVGTTSDGTEFFCEKTVPSTTVPK